MSQGNNNITTNQLLESTTLKANLTLDNVDKFYHFHKFEKFTLTAGNSINYDIEYIPKVGKCLYLAICGDQNPTGNGWSHIKILKNNILLTGQIAESTSDSCNIPFNLSLLDIKLFPCTYTFTIKQGAGTSTYGEDGDFQAPQIVVFEI